MSEITIDLDSGSCSLHKVDAELCCEFPVVPDRLVGGPLQQDRTGEMSCHCNTADLMGCPQLCFQGMLIYHSCSISSQAQE